MIVKTAACAVILGGCGYLGLAFGMRDKKRAIQLGEFRAGLKQLEIDVDFLNVTLCESFEKIVKNSNGGVKHVFEYVFKKLADKRCQDMKMCWEKALRIYDSDLYITETDKKILLDFAKNLGQGNREKEISNIKAADIRLKVAEDEALCDAKQNGKMYRGLGFLGGIFLVILLI